MRGMQQLGAFFIQASGAGCTAAPGLPFLIYPATSPGHPLATLGHLDGSSEQQQRAGGYLGARWEEDSVMAPPCAPNTTAYCQL